MDRTRQLLRQNRIDLSLALDAALAGKACGHDFQAEMGFLTTVRARMVASVKMRIVINSQTLRLQRGLNFVAYAVRDGHRGRTGSGQNPRAVKPCLRQGGTKFGPGNLSGAVPNSILF